MPPDSNSFNVLLMPLKYPSYNKLILRTNKSNKNFFIASTFNMEYQQESHPLNFVVYIFFKKKKHKVNQLKCKGFSKIKHLES